MKLRTIKLVTAIILIIALVLTASSCNTVPNIDDQPDKDQVTASPTATPKPTMPNNYVVIPKFEPYEKDLLPSYILRFSLEKMTVDYEGFRLDLRNPPKKDYEKLTPLLQSMINYPSQKEQVESDFIAVISSFGTPFYVYDKSGVLYARVFIDETWELPLEDFLYESAEMFFQVYPEYYYGSPWVTRIKNQTAAS